MISTCKQMFMALNLVEPSVPPALIAFGDSIVDSGNNNKLNTIFKCDFPPYGKDFDGQVPTGRFSNGRIITDIMVSKVGIKEFLPAYLDPNLPASELPTGVTFASGAAGLDDLTSKLASVISLSSQLVLFQEYMARLRAMVGQERASYIISNAQYLLVVGNNDMWNTYFFTGVRRFHYDVASYSDLLVSAASQFTRELYALGGRKIVVFGLPPLGCVPFVRTLAGGTERRCADDYNQGSMLYNDKLLRELSYLNQTLDGSVIRYQDIYSPLVDMIQNPHKYGEESAIGIEKPQTDLVCGDVLFLDSIVKCLGFEETTIGCCGSGRVESLFLCENSGRTCPDSSKFLVWDSFHPTETAYRLLVDELMGNFISE